MNQEKIGKFIQEKRKEKGLTQSELGDLLGLSYKAVSKWETARAFPDVSILKPLCTELGITLNELFNGEQNNKEIDLGIVDYLKYQKKKYKLKITITIITIITILILSILLIYFINNYNQIKIYELYGESENYNYTGAFFIESQEKLYFINGNLNTKEKDANNSKEPISIEIMSDKRLIAKIKNENFYLYERNGYSELFPKIVLDNIDKWYMKVYYEENGEEKSETIKLSNRTLVSSTNFLSHKIAPIGLIENDDFEEIKQKRSEEKSEQEKYNKNVSDILSKKGYEPLYSFHPVTNENLGVIGMYKENQDGSTWQLLLSSYYPIVSYHNNDYSLDAHSISSYYFYFSGGEGEEKFKYLYNRKTDTGKCEKGNCPYDFIEMAREFVSIYEKEFEGIYFYREKEFLSNYDEIENPINSFD